MITKAERTELRSVVRGQFKVLRSELEQRKAELLADVEGEIVQRFAADDQEWAVAMHKVHEAILQANRDINSALYDHGFAEKGSTERNWVSMFQAPKQPQEKRGDLRQIAHRNIEADMKAALLRLERQEADLLLRTLAVGAIESEEARMFLEAIPTVGELVPVARLAELEAGLADD